MPKHLSLFGKYLRNISKYQQNEFNKKQISKLIPIKCYGRIPSAASQTGLYHDEDFNYYSKISFGLQKTRKKLKPNIFKKNFISNQLNTTIENLRITTSALHAMDDKGGFDEYILRTSPEEMRSHLGEQMRNVMYFYQQNPQIRNWSLPWKVFATHKNQNDPFYSRFKHFLGKHKNEEMNRKEAAKYSPYYLPPVAQIHPERQPFKDDVKQLPHLEFWWKESAELEDAFRRRLGEAKSFERRHPDHRMPDGYRKGEGRGGGGQHGSTLRKRSKTYKYHQTRHY